VSFMGRLSSSESMAQLKPFSPQETISSTEKPEQNLTQCSAAHTFYGECLGGGALKRCGVHESEVMHKTPENMHEYQRGQGSWSVQCGQMGDANSAESSTPENMHKSPQLR
jgi:hypothetical protein